jgi:4-diphosphocytidyl-2-C-methyl-D-erythritol kinase
MPLTLPSFAKINWKLEILGRRADGYHEVRTVLQTISLADTLTFAEISEGIHLTCQDPGIPVDGTNLIERAAAQVYLGDRAQEGRSDQPGEADSDCGRSRRRK